MSGDIDVDALLSSSVASSTKAMCYKTVDVFAGICERKLWLKEAKDYQPKTNGYLIEVPFRHPRVYQYTEHEISHILFQSDVLAKVKFIHSYSKKIGQVAKKSGAPINGRMLRDGLDGIISVLDDERVISLWGLLYKGSEAIMRRMKEDEAAPYLNVAHENLLSLFSSLASGNDVPPGKLDRFRPYMVEALRKVHLRDYFGCMVTAKWLVVQLVSEIIRESRGEDPPPMPKASQLGDGEDGRDDEEDERDDSEGPTADEDEAEDPEVSLKGNDAQKVPEGEVWTPPEVEADVQERSEALQNTIRRLGKTPKSTKTEDELTESKFKRRGEEDWAERKAVAALNASVKDSDKLENTLDQSAAHMLNIVDKARHAVKNTPNHDDRIRTDSYAKVIFTDVEPSPHRDPHRGLGEEDDELVKRLRALFYRVMGRRVNTLEECGSQIDIPAYIERRMTHDAIPIFRVDRFGRGFKTLVLVDRSSSMQGYRTEQAERACRIISRALDFPFVTRSVWGFQGWAAGEVNITRFRAGQEIFESDSARVGGVTPLHTAVRVALRALEDGTERKHLFVISDGYPIYAGRGGAGFGTKTLMNFVRANIMEARSKGVGVTGVMIGHDVKDSEMSLMFGASKHWRVMEDNSFGNDLVQLVTSAFVNYLRSG